MFAFVDDVVVVVPVVAARCSNAAKCSYFLLPSSCFVVYSCVFFSSFYCFVGIALYMPVATSIPSLVKKTIDGLLEEHAPKTLEEAGIKVPSLTWVQLQFCPKNPRSATSLNYTGALNLAHRVQQRTLRTTSIDSHYVAAAYKYMRSYGLWLHEQLVEARCDMSVISASCDDKCKVKPHLHFSLVFFLFLSHIIIHHCIVILYIN